MKVTLEDGREILTIRVDDEGTNLTEEEALEIVKNYISNREKERKAKKALENVLISWQNPKLKNKESTWISAFLVFVE